LQEFLDTIEVMTMIEKYFTEEQREQLAQRRRTVGEERIRAAEQEWADLIAAVRAEMNRGTDPAADAVQALAARWFGLVQEFSGGDAKIERSVATMYRNEPQVSRRFDLDAAMFEYIARARAAMENKR